ncbi:MAG: response regulator [Balneolales bacterium]
MKRILITDDEFVIAASITNHLEQLGYFVTTVTEGPKINAAVKKDRYDLILMNIFLRGGIDGIDTMAKIRTFSSIPVIYLTGNTDITTRDRADKTNPLCFVGKPFDYEELTEAVEQCLNPSVS